VCQKESHEVRRGLSTNLELVKIEVRERSCTLNGELAGQKRTGYRRGDARCRIQTGVRRSTRRVCNRRLVLTAGWQEYHLPGL